MKIANFRHSNAPRPTFKLAKLRHHRAIAISSVTAVTLYLLIVAVSPKPAAAITPPDNCFAFTTSTGTITGYYANEANNSTNPACPKAVDIPSTIGGTNVVAIGSFAFYRMNLVSVSIPNSVVSISSYAFSSNKLTNITVPDSLTSIGDFAFGYNQLISVTINGPVASAGAGIFAYNPITSATYNGTTHTTASAEPLIDACYQMNAGVVVSLSVADITALMNYDNACLGKVANIPNTLNSQTVTGIGDSAFSGAQLTSLTLPSSVVSIGDWAFYDNQLASLTLPDSVTSIGKFAFWYSQLASVTLSRSLISIGDFAFSNNQLTSLTLPDSVTSIGDFAFSNNQLTSLTLSRNLTNFGEGAFSNNNLTSLTLPDNLTSIPAGAFNSNKLTTISIPASVTNINNTAFGMQNPFGGDMDHSKTGDPTIDLWSDDPLLVQNAYDAMWYARLYTADPANPAGLHDGYLNENQYMGYDANQNSTTADSLGGHLINPAFATVTFNDTNSHELQPVQTTTGSLALSSYSLKGGPGTPAVVDTSNPTPDEQAAINAALSVYYRQDQSFSYVPPIIAGYVTPSTYTTASLASGNNLVNFTYAATPPPEDNSTPPTPNRHILESPASRRPVVVNTPKGTALTCSEAVKPSSLVEQDTGYHYPIGLVNFCFTTAQRNNTVSLVFVTDLQPNQVTARKYNPNAHAYATVPGTIITETTYQGEHALELSYAIIDNGDLDVDPTTGSIKDPIGLAVTTVTAPNTSFFGFLSRASAVFSKKATAVGFVTPIAFAVLVVGLVMWWIKVKNTR